MSNTAEQIAKIVMETHDHEIAWPAHMHKARIYIYDKIILPMCMQYGESVGATLMEKYAAADILWSTTYGKQYL